MKTLKGLTITLAISAFILTSCDKDTAAEKKIKWHMDY
jgi:predicted small secreted protein